MSQSDGEVTRRKFIRRTAGTIGALGVAINSEDVSAQQPCEETQALTSRDRPQDRYPWKVDVGPKGILTLFLVARIRRLNLKTLFEWEFHEMVKHMHTRLVYGKGNELHRRQILKLLTESEVETLGENLISTAGFLEADHKELTYLGLAAMPQDSWPDGLAEKLGKIASHISVPILRIDHESVGSFLEQYGEDFDTWGATYEIQELFSLERGRPDRDQTGKINQAALPMIHAARDIGLLWCYDRNRGSGAFDDIQKETPNEEECNWDPEEQKWCCIPSTNPDDYCQIVDGDCNGMST